jgi:CubicO group peptidase (beta-lactamase class C family)
MAKSFVSAMLGKAIMDGYIEGLDQPVSDYFKEFSEGKAAKLTVGDLSTMSSGLNYVEKYYSPFSLTARSYFTSDLESLILGLEVIEEPGQRYKYLSSDTQLLGMILEKATGKNLSDYLSESFWKPMGAKIASPWQVDSKENNLVKAFCCIASNARDFARLGKLYKQNGKWKGRQLLDSSFIAKSLTPKFSNAPFYGYGWWLDKYKGKEIFYLRGHLGQLTIVIPEDDLIIVRLGNLISKEEQGRAHSQDFYTYIDEAYNIIN